MFDALKTLRSVHHASALALAIGVLAPAAHAANFSFSAGFPGSNPGNGMWTYVERDVASLAENNLTALSMTAYSGNGCSPACWTPIWRDLTQRNTVPAVWANNTNVNWQSYGGCCQPVPMPKKCLHVHPGNLKDLVVQFTVPPKPNGGSYTMAHLNGSITHEDFNGGNGVNWSVQVNHGLPPFSGYLNANSTVFPTQGLSVSTGALIDIVVNANNGDEFFDSASVCGSITLT